MRFCIKTQITVHLHASIDYDKSVLKYLKVSASDISFPKNPKRMVEWDNIECRRFHTPLQHPHNCNGLLALLALLADLTLGFQESTRI